MHVLLTRSAYRWPDCHGVGLKIRKRYLGSFADGQDSFGNGLNTSTVPTWQSECSKSHRRGQLVMIEGALITGGVCVSYWIDYGFYYLDPSSAGMIVSLPDSPLY